MLGSKAIHQLDVGAIIDKPETTEAYDGSFGRIGRRGHENSPVPDAVLLRRRHVRIDDLFRSFACDDKVIPKVPTQFGRGPKCMQRVNIFSRPRAENEALSTDHGEPHKTIVHGLPRNELE